MENVGLLANILQGQDILSRVKISNSFQDFSENWNRHSSLGYMFSQ
jgi:hypothetical protein